MQSQLSKYYQMIKIHFSCMTKRILHNTFKTFKDFYKEMHTFIYALKGEI